MRTIPVPLSAGAYDAIVGAGLLAEVRERVEAACPAARYAVIADQTVAELYATRVVTALGATLLTFPAGETEKTRARWTALTDQLLAAGIGRDGALIALGGGVTGDLAGFVAATYLRGIPYVQIPTTILAMVDSSIGGKTGVDAPTGKNLIGAFHQPRLVLADVGTIHTLPVPARRTGLVEALKHGAIADADYFARLVETRVALLDADPDALIDAVARSIAIKADVVAADEREHGRRAILNAGHTIGHALEHATDFQLPHGDAVGIGLVCETRVGERLGLTTAGTATALSDAFRLFGLPTRPPDVSMERVRAALAFDKKNRAGTVRMALVERLGSIYQTKTEDWTVPVDEKMVLDVLQQA